MIRRAILFVVVALLLVVSLWYSQRRNGPLVVSGFIEAHEVRLGSRIGGRVRAVAVDEGSRIEQGDLLVELEPFDLLQKRGQAEALRQQRTTEHDKLAEGYREEEIAQAQARLEQAEANLLLLKNGPRKQELEAARANVELAVAQETLTQTEFKRAKELIAQGAATQETLDRATKELKVAQERVTTQREQLELLEEGTRGEEIAVAQAKVRETQQALRLMQSGYRAQEIASAYAAMQGAESALQAIDVQLNELKVLAPASGIVEVIELQPGDLVAPNAPVISIVHTDELWVRAYVPEDELDLKLGQKLKVTVDSYPGESFTGEITFISRQAEFTPGNVQTPEERSKQVFRIKVVLKNDEGKLRPGMAADVWLEEAR